MVYAALQETDSVPMLGFRWWSSRSILQTFLLFLHNTCFSCITHYTFVRHCVVRSVRNECAVVCPNPPLGVWYSRTHTHHGKRGTIVSSFLKDARSIDVSKNKQETCACDRFAHWWKLWPPSERPGLAHRMFQSIAIL